MTITSPHNEQLKEIRKLAGRKWRDKLRQFVAEGEDLLEAADAAGWEPLARLVAEGSGLPGEEVKPHLLAQVSQLGSGTRALGVYGQRWAPSRPARCAWRCGASTTPATSAPRCAARSRSGRQRRARPGHRRPVRTEGRAGVDGRAVRGAGGPGPHGGGAAGPQDRAGRPRRRAARSRPTATSTLVVGAEREGLPAEVVAACDEVATIPVRAESLNAAMAATVALYECNRRMAAP